MMPLLQKGNDKILIENEFRNKLAVCMAIF